MQKFSVLISAEKRIICQYKKKHTFGGFFLIILFELK